MNVCREADKGGFVECSREDYEEALGALPPVKYFRHGFAMGEPHDGFGENTRYYCFWKFNGRFWCSLRTLKEASAIADISPSGVMYGVGST